MDNHSDDFLFEAKDPLGRRVFLSSNRYYDHILSSDHNHQAHPEFTPDEVKQTIEEPVAIYPSTRLNTDVYFGKTCVQYPNLFIKVPVVLYENETYGEVSTAYLSPHIAGGIDDEKGPKYVKPKL